MVVHRVGRLSCDHDGAVYDLAFGLDLIDVDPAPDDASGLVPAVPGQGHHSVDPGDDPLLEVGYFGPGDVVDLGLGDDAVVGVVQEEGDLVVHAVSVRGEYLPRGQLVQGEFRGPLDLPDLELAEGFGGLDRDGPPVFIDVAAELHEFDRVVPEDPRVPRGAGQEVERRARLDVGGSQSRHEAELELDGGHGVQLLVRL